MRKELFTPLTIGAAVLDKFSNENMEVISGSGKSGKVVAAPYEFDEKGEKKFDESKAVTITEKNCVAFRFISHPEVRKIPESAEIQDGTLLVEKTAVPNSLIKAEKILATMPGVVMFSAKQDGEEELQVWSYDTYRDKFMLMMGPYTTIEVVKEIVEGENKVVILNATTIETRQYGPEAGDKAGEEYPYITLSALIGITNEGTYGYKYNTINAGIKIDKIEKIDEVYGIVVSQKLNNGVMEDLPQVETFIVNDIFNIYSAAQKFEGEIKSYKASGNNLTYVDGKGITKIKSPALYESLGFTDLTVGNTDPGYILVEVIKINDETKLVFANDKREVKLYTAKATRDRGTFVTADDAADATK